MPTSTPSPTTAAVKSEVPDLSPGGSELPEKNHPGVPGTMIKQEGSTRFTDSQLWTKFYDEVGHSPPTTATPVESYLPEVD